MTTIYNDDYWSNQFSVTQDDLKRIIERLEHESAPLELKEIATRIVKGRLEYGHDLSPAALTSLTGKASVRLWDPACKWQPGDLVLVAYNPDKYHPNNTKAAFLGEVLEIQNRDGGIAFINIDGVGRKGFSLATPGSKKASVWREAVREAVEKKLQSGDIKQQAEGVLLKHGAHIFSQLLNTLEADNRFTGLDNKWHVTRNLPRLEEASLRAVHRALLEKPSASIDELSQAVGAGAKANETLLRMAVNAALQQEPARFKNTGTSARPQWQAQLPTPEEAVVTHFAYDPKTYLILCRPGQRLTQKQAQRLQELELYASIVTFAA
jgi:hypothetical protein